MRDDNALPLGRQQSELPYLSKESIVGFLYARELREVRYGLRRARWENPLDASVLADMPYIYFVLGPSGTGKTSLLKLITGIPTQDRWWRIFGGYRDILLVPKLDRVSKIKLIAPQDFMFELYESCRHRGGERFFKRFLTSWEECKRIYQKIEEANLKDPITSLVSSETSVKPSETSKRPLDTVEDGARLLLSLLLLYAGYPTAAVPVIDSVSKLLRYSAEAVGEVVSRFPGWLQKNLPSEDLDKLQKIDLVTSLSEGIRAFSRRQRLLVAVDAYELYAVTCNSSLVDIVRKAGRRVVWIISAKLKWSDTEPIFQEWQNALNATRLHKFELERLKLENILSLMYHMPSPHPTPTEETAEQICKATNGVLPSVVTALERWQKGGSIDQVEQNFLFSFLTQDLPKRLSSKQLSLVYASALTQWESREEKTHILQKVSEPDELIPTILEVARQCAYVYDSPMASPDLMHLLYEPFADVLGDYLLGIRTCKEVKEIHLLAREYLEERKKRIEAGLPTYKNRISDDRWQEIELARIYHHFGIDEDQGWLELAPAVVGAWAVHCNLFLGKLLMMLRSLRPLFGRANEERLKRCEAGLSEQADCEAQSVLLKDLERFLHGKGAADELESEWDEMLAQLRRETEKASQEVEAARSSQKRELLAKEQPLLIPEEEQIKLATSLLECEELADRFSNQGRYSLAIQTYQKALQYDETNLLVLLHLADIYLQQGDCENAILTLQDAREKDKNDLRILNRLGKAYLLVRKFELAKQAFQEALAIDNHCIEARLGLGECYVGLQLLQKAMGEFQQIAGYSPHARRYLADLYMREEDWKEARGMYEWALSSNPDDLDCLLGLAEACYNQGLYNEAETYYRKAHDRSRENFRSLKGLIHSCIKRNDRIGAETFSARAYKLITSGIGHHYDWACIAAMSGNLDQAIQFLWGAIDRDQTLKQKAASDRYLESLRVDPRFCQLIGPPTTLGVFTSPPIEAPKTATHYSRRQPIYFLVSCGASYLTFLSGEKGIPLFCNTLAEDVISADICWISIISFGRGVRGILPLTPIRDFKSCELESYSSGDLGAAMQALLNAIARETVPTTDQFGGDYGAWTILLTDGDPNDDWRTAIENLRTSAVGTQGRIVALGLGNVDYSVLSEIAPHHAGLMPDVTPERLGSFFKSQAEELQKAIRRRR